jgi:hypothetical protein
MAIFNEYSSTLNKYSLGYYNYLKELPDSLVILSNNILKVSFLNVSRK